MSIIIDLCLSPAEASDNEKVFSKALSKSGIRQGGFFRIISRSIDARKKNIKVNLKVQITDQPPVFPSFDSFRFKNTAVAPEVIIIGAGPAGLFAALRCIELGLKPLIFERGKKVSERKRDIASIHRNQPIDPDSNYAFGEGGAGAFSDGKLYTRSHKKGNIDRILSLFYIHGADESVLYDAHPHIGTDKLPGIITSMRNTIEQSEGRFFFNAKVIDFLINNNCIEGIKTSDGNTYRAQSVILATGHSARDIYELLEKKQIMVQPKGFAMGVRVEHPQQLINRIQYHGTSEMEFLPPAAYALVMQSAGRGVYSFCMCPGGFIVPASTGSGERVVNGMSASKRNGLFANAGIVVEIKPEDCINGMAQFKAMTTLEFQKYYEQLAAKHGKEHHIAPAQRLTDFLAGRTSSTLPESSYRPALVSSPMHEWIPVFIRQRLADAFLAFDRKMKGFITSGSIIAGVESRTSSPVRIPRYSENLMHIGIRGLFPAGEGAGYSGGIVSSAIDGERAADAVARFMGCTVDQHTAFS